MVESRETLSMSMVNLCMLAHEASCICPSFKHICDSEGIQDAISAACKSKMQISRWGMCVLYHVFKAIGMSATVRPKCYMWGNSWRTKLKPI